MGAEEKLVQKVQERPGWWVSQTLSLELRFPSKEAEASRGGACWLLGSQLLVGMFGRPPWAPSGGPSCGRDRSQALGCQSP